jgi:ribosomal protein S16
MSVKIRLARAGSKKRPYYHIVVAAATSPRDGKFIDIIGAFNPMLAKDSATTPIKPSPARSAWSVKRSLLMLLPRLPLLKLLRLKPQRLPLLHQLKHQLHNI